MTWPWLICSSAILAARLYGASVTGTVELAEARDARAKIDYSGVVVWLEPGAGARRVAAEPARARMIQKDKTFTPHVLAIPVGSTVDFPNYDPIFHNAFSNYDGQIFDVGLYPPGSSRSIRFARPGIVRVFCNIHANMSAVIAVVDTPWFAVSQKDGTYLIPNVPAGQYTLHVFHERAQAAALEAQKRAVTVGESGAGVPRIVLSESGYLATPHRNKYGRDYPPAPDAGGVYPTVRQ
jgi:plastocyanin